MNIFCLDNNIVKCARYHSDAHVIKMILESAQILCTSLIMHGAAAPYKPTHQKHPCVIWASKSAQNWLWLKNLTLELDKEYCYRWNKNKSHKSAILVEELSIVESMENIGITERPQAMPEKYKIKNDPVLAYRQYYSKEKAHLCKYTKRETPPWLEDSKC